MATLHVAARFSGRAFRPEELALMQEVVESCAGVSRAELAKTICELLGWHRPRGALKGRECGEFLEQLEAAGRWRLPAKRPGRPRGRRTAIPVTARGEPGVPLTGTVGECAPIILTGVARETEHQLFRELVGRYHPLGSAAPFGAHLRYLVWASRPAPTVVGCVQFSSPAWRMAARDQWIGWDDATRRRNLQRVVTNSRFLLLPWVRVRNLASTVLAQAARQVAREWPARYGVAPLLLETLVDPRRYHGGCYRATNWIEVGVTTGRGRMDREHRRHGSAPKTVLVYPLVPDAARRLREA